MATAFTLPDLGENIDSGDVVSVLVAPGDTVKPGQAVLEVETDKAVIEVPCPPGGVVKEVLVKKGETVAVGQKLLSLEAAGAAAAAPPASAAATAPPAEKPAAARPAAAGAEPPAPGATPTGQLVALAFGQITAPTLAALAEIGPLRVTPWRMLLLEGATMAPDLPGLIHDAADPRLAIDVCTGAPGCPQGLSSTRDLARELAPLLSPGQRLHVSGCAKGCAHPGPAPLTLTATGPDRFDLIREGSADAPPEATGLTRDQIKKAL